MSREETEEYLSSLYSACAVKKQIEKESGNIKFPILSMGIINKGSSYALKQRFKIITEYKDSKKPSQKIVTAFLMILGLLFCFSFAFVVQPYSEPIYEKNVTIDTDSRCYAILLDDGMVKVYLGVDPYGEEEVLVCTYEDFQAEMGDVPIYGDK